MDCVAIHLMSNSFGQILAPEDTRAQKRQLVLQEKACTFEFDFCGNAPRSVLCTHAALFVVSGQARGSQDGQAGQADAGEESSPHRE